MSGDITRSTFHPEKHFSSVRWQQGRVPLDADYNEQVDIQEYRDRTEADDVIGPIGAPRDPAAGHFALAVVPGGGDLRILPGRIYVDGILVELEGGATPADTQFSGGAANQAKAGTLTPDGRPLGAGDWVEVFDTGGASQIHRVSTADAATRVITFQPGDDVRAEFPGSGARLRRVVTYLTQPDLPSPQVPTAAGAYVAYLDVWERDISALDDPDILEVALGGADTATRRRVTWQLRLAPLASGTTTCDAAPLPPLLPPGLLAAKSADAPESKDPCVIKPKAGYRSLENQLYRVQIFRAGVGGAARYVWSRDNAAVAIRVRQSSLANNLRLPLGALARDAALRFQSGGWIELSDDAHELAGRSGTLVKFNVDGNTLALDPTTAIYFDANGTEQHDVGWNQLADDVKARLWDSDGLLDVPADATAWVELESGVHVRFAGGGTYGVGDFWEIPARTVSGTVEWPADGGPGSGPKALPPRGVYRARCKLGVVTRSASQFTDVVDCRPLFPPLTDIHASDVTFDPKVCDFVGAKTVQDALDHICRSLDNECCCVSLTPADDAQAVIDEAVAKAHANGTNGIHVCFSAGDFRPRATLVFKNLAVVVTGTGAATRLFAPPEREQALSFVGCADVRVRDLYAEASFAGPGRGRRHRPESDDPNDANRHLRGVIGFHNCGAVELERVSVKSGSAAQRSASCVSVHNDASGVDAPGAPSARVRGCDFLVGHQQVGLLLVNVDRARVEDNGVAVYGKPADLGLADLIKNDVFRARLRKMLLSSVTFELAGAGGTPPGPGPSTPPAAGHEATLHVGDNTLRFRAPTRSVAEAWTAILGSPPGALITKPLTVLPRAEAPIVTGRPPAVARPGVIVRRARSVRRAAGAAAPAAAARTSPVTVRAVAEVRRRLDRIANGVILHLAGVTAGPAELLTRDNLRLFRDWFQLIEANIPSVASHGIVVGGSRASDIRILDNTIQGAVDGIHVALSHADPQRRGPADRLGRVRIAGNTLTLAITMEVSGTPCGIFVGTTDSVAIEDNYVEVIRRGNPRVTDCIRLYGNFGGMLLVQRNHVVGANVGVRATATAPVLPVSSRLWTIDANAATRVQTPVVNNF